MFWCLRVIRAGAIRVVLDGGAEKTQKAEKAEKKRRQSVKISTIPKLDLAKLPPKKPWSPPEGLGIPPSARIFSVNKNYDASDEDGESEDKEKQPISRRKPGTNRKKHYTRMESSRNKSVRLPNISNNSKSLHSKGNTVEKWAWKRDSHDSGKTSKKKKKKKKGGRRTRKYSK